MTANTLYHGFELMVNVHRRPDLLDDNFEYMGYVGVSALKQMFVHEQIDTQTKELVFWFPERWLNIIQERSLYPRIKKFFPNVTKVTINTQSVYIIQMTKAEHVQIVSSARETAYLNAQHGAQVLPGECESGITSFPIATCSDFSTLQVFHKD